MFPRQLAGLLAAAVLACNARGADYDPLERSILDLQLAMTLGRTSAVELVDF